MILYTALHREIDWNSSKVFGRLTFRMRARKVELLLLGTFLASQTSSII